MAEQAYIVHTLPERTRLRVPSRRHDPQYFSAIDETLRGFADVRAVQVNPTTASILVHHRPDALAPLLTHLTQKGWLAVAAEATPPPAALPQEPRPGSPLRYAAVVPSSGELRLIVAVILVALALRQALRGEILVPAMSLLWYAFEVMNGRAGLGAPPE